MDQTETANFADRNKVRSQVMKTMTVFDPELLEKLTDVEMRKHDIEIYVV